MADKSKHSRLNDRIQEIEAKRTVGIYVDLDSVLSMTAPEKRLTHDHLSNVLLGLARSVGRVVDGRVYYSTNHEDYSMNARPWNECGFTPVKIDGVEDDGIASMTLGLDANATTADVCILVVGDVNYNLVARYLMKRGVVCVIVGEYSRDMRILPRDNCVYVPIGTVLDKTTLEPEFDVDGYDYTDLIKLLNESERLMPFVGTKHFINRVMWRLDPDQSKGLNRQAVFQAAVDKNIIELYETDNNNGTDNKVSSCKLNSEHPEVDRILVPLMHDRPTHIAVSVTTPDGNTIRDDSGLSHQTL